MIDTDCVLLVSMSPNCVRACRVRVLGMRFGEDGTDVGKYTSMVCFARDVSARIDCQSVF